MIEVSHLAKRYGSKLAVDDVSFDVGKGDVVGFLGPNGAGKSTTLRILSGFLGMSSGSVKIAGQDIVAEPFLTRQAIGYMPESVPLYPEMRVVEYLAYRAELKRVPRGTRRAQVDLAMEKAKVADVATTLIGNLSKGYRQRVGLADALVARPPILILDEPTAGLDPNQIREVRALIKELGAEHTVLLSTHILSEVESSCTRVLVIAKGKLVAQGATRDIQQMRRSRSLEVTVRGKVDDALRVLNAIEGVAKVAKDVGSAEADVATLRCTWTKKLPADSAMRAAEAAVAALVGAGIAVREVRGAGGSLEEVFAELTRGDIDGTSAASPQRGHDKEAPS
jgi:ABC-2 type transport system ATP-binding protein